MRRLWTGEGIACEAEFAEEVAYAKDGGNGGRLMFRPLVRPLLLPECRKVCRFAFLVCRCFASAGISKRSLRDLLPKRTHRGEKAQSPPVGTSRSGTTLHQDVDKWRGAHRDWRFWLGLTQKKAHTLRLPRSDSGTLYRIRQPMVLRMRIVRGYISIEPMPSPPPNKFLD
jgi:hypothetical protein